MKKVYLAGPDVFFRDALERAQRHKQMARAHGFEPLHPVDQEAPDAPSIYRQNIALIEQSDAVVANVNPFRGAEVDSGTAFEIGFAVARGIPVVAYRQAPDSVLETVRASFGPLARDPDANGLWRDRDGAFVEDFGLPVNLMIAVSTQHVQGGLEDALRALRLHFEGQAAP